MKSKPLPDGPPEDAAGTKQTLDFLHQLYRRRADKKAFDEYIHEFPLGTLRGFARRIMMDVLKGPQVDTEFGPASEVSRPAEPKPTTRRPRSTVRRRQTREL